MCKSEIHNMDPALLAPVALFLNQYFNTFLPETWLLMLAMVTADFFFNLFYDILKYFLGFFLLLVFHVTKLLIVIFSYKHCW